MNRTATVLAAIAILWACPLFAECSVQTIYIELIVDGEIVDLNRIPLPADTPIIDERFKDSTKK